jgi:hypothetical protein
MVHDVGGYIVDHYCLAFVREVVHDVVGYILDHYCQGFVLTFYGRHHELGDKSECQCLSLPVLQSKSKKVNSNVYNIPKYDNMRTPLKPGVNSGTTEV